MSAIPKDKREKALARLRAGEGPSTVARELGISHSGASYLRRVVLSFPPLREVNKTKNRLRGERLIADGLTDREIAERIGVVPSAVNRWRQVLAGDAERNAKRRPRNGKAATNEGPTMPPTAAEALAVARAHNGHTIGSPGDLDARLRPLVLRYGSLAVQAALDRLVGPEADA
jgi:transposase-like protein